MYPFILLPMYPVSTPTTRNRQPVTNTPHLATHNSQPATGSPVFGRELGPPDDRLMC